MTYSELTITFNIDYETPYTLTIVRSNGGTTTQTWDWVVTRAVGFEVTTGSPTATAGETAAINFKAAFDLDNPTGFETVQTLNEIVIKSETLGEDFIGVSSNNGTDTIFLNGSQFTTEFNNFVAPPDTSDIDLALVRSPHYVSTNFDIETTTKAIIDVTIWSGDLDDMPATVTYSLTRLRPTADAVTLDTNLSEIIRSQLTPVPNIVTAAPSQLVDSDSESVKWIYYNVSFTNPTVAVPNIEGTFSALDGYGYYNQNANPSKPTNKILLSNIGTKKIASNGVILIPFINDGTYTSVDVDTESGDINTNFVITTDVASAKFVQYVIVDPSQTTDRQVTITFNGDTPLSFVVSIVDECRYNPKTILFKNKNGAFEAISMFKKSTSSISTSKEDFVNQFTTNKTYDITAHQFRNINFEATEKISLNSGYISEDENESYKQLLLSDQVWFYEDGTLVPVNVETNDLTFKDRVNDRLVNYTIEFKYSYNTIQNV
jgi:hypothetical protein